ncbi:hypothetical protein JCM19233_1819 [Vibrio astriarenae]|nr:hypothetical protein JCM19233_1819 [Vibrio sp. C7]
MSFPVTQEGRIISEVNLTTDGSKILYFTAGDVTRALADYLSEDATAWLNENTTVTPNQLSEYGIDLVLDSQTLTVEMKLQAENSALRTIGLDRYGDSNDPYTAAATWSWQNNFNLAHQYYDNSDNDETTIDWLVERTSAALMVSMPRTVFILIAKMRQNSIVVKLRCFTTIRPLLGVCQWVILNPLHRVTYLESLWAVQTLRELTLKFNPIAN